MKKTDEDFGEVNTNRRHFLKSVSALAALAVVPTSLVALARDDVDRLLDIAKRQGVVDGYTFRIDRTIVIDFSNVTIQNCTFIAEGDVSPMFELSDGATNIRVVNCVFSNKGSILSASDLAR